jgi:heat shock protein HspQ
MAKFKSGQIIHHKRFGYRGVVICVDECFQGSDEWYEKVAPTHPPKDRPWYHVLVDNSAAETYVAERHLEADESNTPVQHPLVNVFFDKLREGRYIRDRLMN